MNKYKINKCFRFDEKTQAILNELVKNRNENRSKKLSESEFVRELIHRCRHEEIGLPRDTFIQINRNLSGLGNNVNQIAHRVNMDVYTYEDVLLLRNCISDLAEIKKVVKDLFKELY